MHSNPHRQRRVGQLGGVGWTAVPWTYGNPSPLVVEKGLAAWHASPGTRATFDSQRASITTSVFGARVTTASPVVPGCEVIRMPNPIR